MPNPAKERSPQELTEGQPSNVSSSQEMKELLSAAESCSSGVRSNCVSFLTLLPQVQVERENVRKKDCRGVVLNHFWATDSFENLQS